MDASREKEPSAKDHDVAPEPPPEVREEVRERVRAQASPVRCPFCHEDVEVRTQRWVACAACLARHHGGCWGEAGRCAACGDAASLAGGGGRPRWLVAALLVPLLVLAIVGGVRFTLQAQLAEIQRGLSAIEQRQAEAEQLVVGPYLGETPEVRALRERAPADAAAAHDLAVALGEGVGVAPDRPESLRWFREASDRGDARAMRRLAALYAAGDPRAKLEADPHQAAFWYGRALELAFDVPTAEELVRALRQAGRLHEAGPVVERLHAAGHRNAAVWGIELSRGDDERLKGWLERAETTWRERGEAGDVNGASRYLQLLAEGRVELDGLGSVEVAPARPVEALAWLERRVGAGDTYAMRSLARVHRNGDLDLPRDAAKALEWQLRAAEAGDAIAQADCVSALAHDRPADAARFARRLLATKHDGYVASVFEGVLTRRPDLREPADDALLERYRRR